MGSTKNNLAMAVAFVVAFCGGFFIRGLLGNDGRTKAVVIETRSDRPPPSYAAPFENAVLFRNESRKETLGIVPDSLGKAFLKQYVKPIRNANGQSESLSLPKTALSGDYYLIVNDSIYLMSPTPVRFVER